MRPENLPREFIDEVNSLLGADADAFWQAFDRPHYRALRLNPRAGLAAQFPCAPSLALDFGEAAEAAPDSRFFAARDLADKFIDRPVAWQRGAHYIPEDTAPGISLCHLLGLYYMQEPSAMSAGAALDVKPGMNVLDLCAAPGGKSSQLAAALGGHGLLVSNEPIPSRAQMLASNLERQGFSNAVVTNEYPDRLAQKWGARFDAILCDAPCSGEGMFRRDEAAIGQWTPDSPRLCHERQLEILDSAYAMLKSGGVLVYSTCTFNHIENEGTINEFLRRHADISPEDFELCGIGRSEGGMLRVWPHLVEGEGHFICRMRKRGAGDEPIYPAPSKSKRSKPMRCEKSVREKTTSHSPEKALAMLRDVIELPELRGTLTLLGAHLYLLPENCPPLDGIKLARAGLELAEIGRSHIEPAYALARALAPVADSLEINAANAIRMVRGEQLDIDAPGGYLLTHWRGLPICFGKAHGGIIKSHYPRGLKPLGTIAEELT